MNREEIIRMAREGKAVVEQVHAYVSANDTDFTSESMAAMVRDFMAAEREMCAKVCEQWGKDIRVETWDMAGADCAAAIREALAEQPAQQEPMIDVGVGMKIDASAPFVLTPHPAFQQPASKPWVGLTPAEAGALWKVGMTPHEFSRAIEAKLRERNA